VIRLLLIPIAGTIAAFLAVTITRTPREGSDYPLPDLRSNIQKRYETARKAQADAEARKAKENENAHAEEAPPAGDKQPAEAETPAPEEPAPKYVISVDAQGTYRDIDSGDTYASAESLAEALPKRARIVLYNRDGAVTEEQLGAAAESLRKHFEQVQTSYKAPD